MIKFFKGVVVGALCATVGMVFLQRGYPFLCGLSMAAAFYAGILIDGNKI